MEVHITTLKKKLTKSLVKQMRFASLEVMKYGEPLGYMIGITNACRAFLILYKEEYFILNGYWIVGIKSIWRRNKKYTETMKFSSEEEREEWAKEYQRIWELELKQIYV